MNSRTRLLILFILLINPAACKSRSVPGASINSFAILTASPTGSPTGTVTATITATPQPRTTATAILPTATPEIPQCMRQGGSIEIKQLQTDLLPEPLIFRIYLPPCYSENKSQQYPVLYLVHGQSFSDDQWERLKAGEITDRLIEAGEFPAFIIVMPRDRSLFQQPDQDHFGDAVVQVLVPWIDQHYRTLTERKYRAVGGLSRGGGWALHIGLSHWELFGAVGLHSLAIFWTDTFYIKKWLSAIPEGKMPRLYLDIGNNDREEIRESASWFENLLTQRDIPHEWHVFTGYHDEVYWGGHVETYLRWYVQAWQ
ncbi:MAG: alpha/beta hydrolase [Omnitrophica WOR_2 bacterium]